MSDLPPSSFAPTSFPTVHDIAGMTQRTGHTATKYHDRDDLLIVQFERPATVAGVFTQSSTAAAPVDWCRRVVNAGPVSALVVNAGNANAFTGAAGDTSVRAIAQAASERLGVQPQAVAVASTGVIGEVLDDDKMTASVADICNLQGSANWEQAARCIMTTDTYPKAASRRYQTIDGAWVTISGYAKGSGMIQPDMATMLGFVYTDASVEKPLLQSILQEVTTKTFNCITVDSDTSTNDTVLVMATGASDAASLSEQDAKATLQFTQALTEVCRDLALQIVKDGEGISRLMTITVSGARNTVDAHTVAMSIGNSPLVKTAVAGEDANWGRIVMAIGKTTAEIDKSKISVSVANHLLAANGNPNPGVDIPALDAAMREREIAIEVDLGLANGVATIWASDLTHGYISINADYRS